MNFMENGTNFDLETKKVRKLMQAENKDEMRDKILEAALRRFTHYGAAKTTMNEIADDLHCSKASLYYYYPDKNAMHIAVLQKIAESFFSEMEEEARNVKSATRALERIIEIRETFLTKFCRLEIFKILQNPSPTILEEMEKAKKREIEIHTQVIKAGVQSGEFKVKHPGKTAELLVLAVNGLRFSVPNHVRPDMEMDDELFAEIIDKQKQLLEIFIKGMKA
ncbi:MAG TPA: TetR/AcrR family transcriptional regulator [Chitinophaga sp.]|uniref:TetR/AcrR family transcriptional regulator n=1 Tax=Chitinophaga sp. TaxID=1869181 RepID=UPI002C51C8CD|nr:TetR/AcrR family transcriptional regulator [Chitinophaga sp.]HVI46302.1 TetR/AcrR family transcriptional regulator [Chitinophaga sp.]